MFSSRKNTSILVSLCILAAVSSMAPPPNIQDTKENLKNKMKDQLYWKIGMKDFKQMNVSSILSSMDITDPFVSGIVAKLANKWSLEDKLMLLKHVSDSNDRKLIKFYGGRINFDDVKLLADFESLKGFIPMMSTKRLMKVKNKDIQTVIFTALQDSNIRRAKMLPLFRRYFGPPSKWTNNDFLSALPFLQSIPAVKLRQLNSTMVYEERNQLDSLFHTYLMDNKPQGNAIVKVLLRHLNWSDPTDVETFKKFVSLRHIITDIDDLPDKAEEIILVDRTLVPNLELSSEEVQKLLMSTLNGKNTYSSADLVNLGKEIPRIRPRKLMNVNLDKKNLAAAVSGRVYSKQNRFYLAKQAENLYNKQTQFTMIPMKLLSRVMKRSDIAALSEANGVQLFDMLHDVNIKDSVDMGQILALINKIGGATKLINANIMNVGDFAVGIPAQDTDSWTVEQFEKLLMQMNGDNPILESLYVSKKFKETNFTAADIGSGKILRSLTATMWMNILEMDLSKILTNENVIMLISNYDIPEVVNELSKGLMMITKSKLKSENMAENMQNMIAIHPDLSVFPAAVVARAFSLDEIMKMGKCTDLLLGLPRVIFGMINFGGRKARNMFGEFLGKCVMKNNEYFWDVLSSAAFVDLPEKFISNEVSGQDLLATWITQDPRNVQCIPDTLAETIAEKIQATLTPEDVGIETYHSLGSLFKYFSKSFIEDVPGDILVDAELKISSQDVKMKSANNPNAAMLMDKMHKMCKAYLSSEEMEEMKEVKENFNEIVRSMTMKVSQEVIAEVKAEENARPKRAAKEMLTCNEVQMAGGSILSFSLDEINTLSTMEILDCFDTFGEQIMLKPSIRDVVLNKTLEGLGGLGDTTLDDLEAMGYLLLSLTPEQVNNSLAWQQLDSWQMARIFGKISKCMEESLMEEIVSNLKQNLKSSLTQFTTTEIADLKSLFCKFPLDEIKN